LPQPLREPGRALRRREGHAGLLGCRARPRAPLRRQGKAKRAGAGVLIQVGGRWCCAHAQCVGFKQHISSAKRMAASLAENLCCCARIETEQRMAFQSSASVRLRLSNPHLVTAPHRPVLPPGSSLASCGKSPAARRNQNGPTTPPKTEVSGGNGTWDAAGGHFHGTLASSGRALLPAVRHQRNLPN
jgi:hypothetical protein